MHGVFLLYAVYVLFFSLFHSSEENVILGKSVGESYFSRLELKVVNSLGCAIPYSLVFFEVFERSSPMKIAGVVVEVLVYMMVKDSLVTYIKNLCLFPPGSTKLPLNPSGHTFMFLNGIFVLLPVLIKNIRKRSPMCILSLFVVYEYNRLLCNTALYYHTFYDISLGVILFSLFRALVQPVRRVYEEGARKSEWGVPGYVVFSLCVFGVAVCAQFFLWEREDVQSSLET